MTDTPPEEPAAHPPAEAPGEQAPPARRPSSAAAAASRARRIGGRPAGSAGAPSPGPRPAPAAEPGEPVTGGSVRLDKSSEPSAGPAGALPPPPERVEVVPAWVNWAPAAVLTVGAAVMAVLLVVVSHGVWWGPADDAAPSAAKVNTTREQVLAAAKTCVATTNNYKYTDLAGYERKALACTTGHFTTVLRQTIESLVKVNAPKLKAAQTAQINRAGIEAVTPDGTQWTLIVFGQLSVVNSSYPKGRTDPFGAQVRMEKVKGKWLMSNLSTVSSPVQG
jgi:hypothetical protein